MLQIQFEKQKILNVHLAYVELGLLPTYTTGYSQKIKVRYCEIRSLLRHIQVVVRILNQNKFPL